MAFYKSVQDVSDAMIWVKKLCRELSPRFAKVQACLDAIGDCKELRAASEKADKPHIQHLDLAEYRHKVAIANAYVEEANKVMAEVHMELNRHAVRCGVADHEYSTSDALLGGPGGRPS